MELDLPAASIWTERKGGGIEHDEIEALAVAIEIGEGFKGIASDEAVGLGGELVEGKVLFAASEGFFGKVNADGLSSGGGRDDAEATGVSKGVEQAFGAEGLDFGAIVALIEKKAMAVASGEV